MAFNAKRVVKVDKLTREAVEAYRSIWEAAEINEMCAATVGNMCRSHTLPTGRYYYRYEDDFDPAEDFTGRVNTPIILYDMETNELRWFPSTKAVCKRLGVSGTSVYNALNHNIILLERFKAKRLPK